MPQADGTNDLKRVVLHLPSEGDKGWYRFKVNPENYSIEMPQRTSVIKTKSDIIIEDYGKDIEVINFSGTTGFKPIMENGVKRNGKDKIEELEHIITKYAKGAGDGNQQSNTMFFYNMTDGSYYKVHLAPQGLKITRSKDEPLLFRYDITLMVLGDAFEPDRNSIADPELGNKAISSEKSLQDKLNNLYPSAKKSRDINNNTKDNNNNNSSTKRLPQTQTDTKPKTYSPTANGNRIYNPRNSTNGLKGNVSNMAMIIGYGNGGVDA